MKVKADPYFVLVGDPYSGKPRLKTGRILALLGTGLGVAVVALLLTGHDPESTERKGAAPKSSLDLDAAARQAQTMTRRDDPVALLGVPTTIKAPVTSGASRQYTASQIVGRAAGAGPGGGPFLPQGTTFPVRLVTRLVSSDQGSPAIATVTSEVLAADSIIIPEDAKILGNAAMDSSGDRLQIHFHTLVYPDGSQHQVSGLALLADGSSGLAGTYHSDAAKEQAGAFASYFLGGLADGLQDKASLGGTGITLTPGSLRNGVLNGLATSSLAEGKNLSDIALKAHPYLDVEAGQVFLIYLEKEYAL